MLACVLLLAFSVACGGDDDDSNSSASTAASPTAKSTPVTSAATSTTAGGAAGGSATTSAASPTTAEASATATKAEGTATTAEASATEEEASATATEEASPTGQAGATETSSSDDPLADVQQINPEDLPNFTMTFTFDSQGMTDTTQNGVVSADVEQASPENYHIKFESSGQTAVEVWRVGDTYYSDFGTGITSQPASDGTELFTPTTLVSTVPQIEDMPGVENKGTDRIEGRKTTHYFMNGQDYIQSAIDEGQGSSGLEGATDAAGGIDFWIDNDLKILLKGDGDITWKNADGSDGEFKYNLAITDIGNTAEVTAPQ